MRCGEPAATLRDMANFHDYLRRRKLDVPIGYTFVLASWPRINWLMSRAEKYLKWGLRPGNTARGIFALCAFAGE